jgi:NADPH:quinone reductase-like Zn-dependent oxidoreductase
MQLARLAGVSVIGTASASKHELLHEHQAFAVDSQSEDIAMRVIRLTDGRGVDAAFDPVGGSHLHASHAALATRGHLVCFGSSSTITSGRDARLGFALQAGRLAFLRAQSPRKRVSFYNINGPGQRHAQHIGTDLGGLVRLLQAGQVKPVVGRRFPLEGAAEAQAMLEQRIATGKLVLEP